MVRSRILVGAAGVLSFGLCMIGVGCGNTFKDRESADQVAIVRDGTAFITDPSMDTFVPVDVPDVVGVAFDSEGQLWLSELVEDNGIEGRVCQIRPQVGTERIDGGVIAAAVDRADGGCEIATGPAGTLYVQVDNNATTSSEFVARVDPQTEQVKPVIAGSGVSATRRGDVAAAVTHRYLDAGGSEGPVAVLIGDEAEPLIIDPPTGGYHNAVAPHGAAMIAAAIDGNIEVGDPKGRLAIRCMLRLEEGWATKLVWLSDGRILARTTDGAVLACESDGRVSEIARNVDDLAVR